MNVAARVHRILADPSAEWTEIASEAGDAAYLLTGYVAVLALIPAVFGFVGVCIVGVAVPGDAVVRASVFDGLFGAVLGYVLSCATVLVLALLIDALAPLFGGRRNFDNAFRVAVYSYTPVWLAGIFLLAPGLRFLGLLALYGIYPLWSGLPQLMKAPAPSLPAYATTIVLCACGLIAVAAMAQHALFGLPGL